MINRRLSCKPPAEGVLDVVSGDFPLESRLAEYVLCLLELNQLSRMLLEIIFSILSSSQAWEISMLFKKDNSFEILKENLKVVEDADDLARAFFQGIGAATNANAKKFIKAVRPLLEKEMKKDCASYRRRVAQLQQKLDLDSDEVTLLELGCCYSLNDGLERLLDSFNKSKKVALYSFITQIPRARLARLVSAKGNLKKNSWLVMSANNLNIDDSIFEFLIGNDGKEFALNAFKPVKRAEIPLDLFELKPIQKRALKNILQSKSPAHLLFYGKAGTGKTELAKTLTQACELDAVVVDYGSDGDARDRKTALLTTINSVSKETLIIVDEVDDLLNTQNFFRVATVNKGWINQFMDACKHKVIWITNNSGGIEESVRRRFSYSLYFKALSWRQRQNIWKTQLRKHRLKRFFSEEKIQILSKRFTVSPGLISYAIKTIKQSRTPEMDTAQLYTMIDEVLTRQMELTEGRKPEKKLNDINENYDPEALHTDIHIPRLLRGLEQFNTSKKSFGMNLLFWGWPGTGKTEFGKYIADQLGKELLVKRMSDLQSMWVGETEKQIAAAFREAEENDAILFIDEADSVFINRQTANKSWETSQTNEILTQMENFSGILICCTNLLENLDEAAMRRFAFKIKFLPLTNEGKVRLYQKYFSSLTAPLSKEQQSRLVAIRNLCPGDIKAVWQRTQMLGNSPSDEIISELEKEVSYKKGGNKSTIGFAAG